METVQVKTADLLERVKTNRQAHACKHGEAVAGWHSEVIEKLEEALEAARAGTSFGVHFGIVEPTSHLDDYDDAIDMLENEQRETIEVTRAVWRELARDLWRWSDGFNASHTHYSNAGASPAGRVR